MKKILFFIFLLLAIVANAKVYYVDGSRTGSAQTGLSWETAFLRIEPALKIATKGDEVWWQKEFILLCIRIARTS